MQYERWYLQVMGLSALCVIEKETLCDIEALADWGESVG